MVVYVCVWGGGGGEGGGGLRDLNVSTEGTVTASGRRQFHMAMVRGKEFW